MFQVRAAIDASPLKCPEAIKMGLIDDGAYRDQVLHSLDVPISDWEEDPAKPGTLTRNVKTHARVGIKRYIAHQEREKVAHKL